MTDYLLCKIDINESAPIKTIYFKDSSESEVYKYIRENPVTCDILVGDCKTDYELGDIGNSILTILNKDHEKFMKSFEDDNSLFKFFEKVSDSAIKKAITDFSDHEEKRGWYLIKIPDPVK